MSFKCVIIEIKEVIEENAYVLHYDNVLLTIESTAFVLCVGI